ncbi:MAG: hypothetical protein FWB77_04650 [Treponema sp.]|nr:hypothetical protein [Treponema sp.]
MKTNNTFNFINTLLEKFNISLETVIDFIVENNAELDQIKEIFKLKNNNDAELLVTVPYILMPSEEIAFKVVNYLKNEESENAVLGNAIPDVEKHKLLLLSAFVHNQSFFSMSWNWCAFIREKIYKKINKNASVTEESVYAALDARTAQTPQIENDGSMIIYIFRQSKRIERYRASTDGNRAFGEPTHLEGIGDLHQLLEEVGEHLYFQFHLSITNENLARPFELEIEFSAIKDGKVHVISIIDDTNQLQQSVRSIPVDDVDASQGIEIRSIRFKPAQNHE